MARHVSASSRSKPWLVGACVALSGIASCTMSTFGTAPSEGSASTSGSSSAGGGDLTIASASSSASGGGMGGATSASSSASASSNANASSGPIVEDCTNGQDDDLDGATDCDDSDCDAFECVDAAPVGFDGFFRFDALPFSQNPNLPLCPDQSAPNAVYEGKSSADCAPCTCGSAAGVCNPPPVECFGSAKDCTGAMAQVVVPADGTCKANNLKLGGNASCKMTGPATLSGAASCPPSGGELAVPEPWAFVDGICGQATPGGKCADAAKACVPKGAGDFTPLCVRKNGDAVCSGAYAKKHLTSTAIGADTRACSACGCDAATVTCSGGKYEAWDKNDCSGSHELVDNALCHDVSGQSAGPEGALQLIEPPALGGGCTPTGGVGSGDVMTPNADVTYCCQ